MYYSTLKYSKQIWYVYGYISIPLYIFSFFLSHSTPTRSHGVSIHRRNDSSYNYVFRLTRNQTSRLRITSPSWGNPVDSPHEGPVMRLSVSTSQRHHATSWMLHICWFHIWFTASHDSKACEKFALISCDMEWYVPTPLSRVMTSGCLDIEGTRIKPSQLHHIASRRLNELMIRVCSTACSPENKENAKAAYYCSFLGWDLLIHDCLCVKGFHVTTSS